ncbi:MAG: alanine--tRNA ligase [Exilispira sp.]
MLSSNEIRELFLKYFEQREHKIFESSPVVPYDDPTLLFTNAGMNQFKKIFLGEVKSDLKRAASAQKCIRVSGKHNDLEEVGRDGRHHTFFEMLGNWSFGDYYKRESLKWGWDFLVNVLKLDPSRLYVSVYKDDDESYDIWAKEIGVSEEKIYRLGDIEKGDEENFWSMGETGPCGPCSEIYYDQGPAVGCGRLDCSITCGCDRFLEVWNHVFMQYNRDSSGKLNPLPFKSVDTGMGLERILAIVQNVTSNYETDLFEPIIKKLTELTGFSFEEKRVPFQIICDHIRMLTFAIADGAFPSNEGRGFVVRRILRRAARQSRYLNIKKPFLYQLVPSVTSKMGVYYKEIVEKEKLVMDIIKSEEEKFNKTLDKGLELFNEKLSEIREKGLNKLDAETVFTLHDTYGFPLDLTKLMCEENSITLDEKGFENLMEKQRERSRNIKTQYDFSLIEKEGWNIIEKAESKFTGYVYDEKDLCIQSSLISYNVENDRILVFFKQTPFYAESGGQVADSGYIFGFINQQENFVYNDKNFKTFNNISFEYLKSKADVVLKVENVFKTVKGNLHLCIIEDGKNLVNDPLQFTKMNFILKVNSKDRFSTMRNHTATHLLHQALIDTLGSHVQQSGSFVCPEYLRFDFPHHESLKEEQIEKIENIVNEKIMQNIPVIVHNDLSLEEAKKMNAKALFTEKYGDRVRVVEIPGYSIELCGGTHSPDTGFIGGFVITSESSIAAGTRRIEAVTGNKVLENLNNFRKILKNTAEVLQIKDINKIYDMVIKIKEEDDKLRKENEILRNKVVNYSFDLIIKKPNIINDIPHYLAFFEQEPIDNIKKYADKFKSEKDGVILLINKQNDSNTLICAVSKNYTSKIKAKEFLQNITRKSQGSSGGKDDFAQGGVKNFDLLISVIKEYGFSI